MIKVSKYYKMTGEFELFNGEILVYDCIVKVEDKCHVDYISRIVAGGVILDDRLCYEVGDRYIVKLDIIAHRGVSVTELDTNTCVVLYG